MSAFIDMSESFWQIQDASAKFSQLVEKVRETGIQIITKRGEPVVVMISKQRYDDLTKPMNSLLDFFNGSPLPEVDLTLSRNKDLPREVEL